MNMNMKMYRCSLTGFFSNNNGQMQYDENNTVILNINVPDNLTGPELASSLMGSIFSPREPMGAFPLHTYRVGEYWSDESNNEYSYIFYKKDDPLVAEHLSSDDNSSVKYNEPVTFKITKLTNEQKQADEFSSVPYLDVYDALIDFTDDKSDKLESLGYVLPKLSTVDEQIVFQSLNAIKLFMPYRSDDVWPEEIPSVSCDGAGTYILVSPMTTTYDEGTYTEGILTIVDAVSQTGKTYFFRDFTEFFDSQWVRDTIAYNHQSLVIEQASASDGYIIGLYGTHDSSGNSVNATKISIEMRGQGVNLMVSGNSSATGSETNTISACLSPVNFFPY